MSTSLPVSPDGLSSFVAMPSSSPHPRSTNDDGDDDNDEKKARRFCFNRLSKRNFIILLISLFLLFAIIGTIVTYFIAKSVIAKAQVIPTRISMQFIPSQEPAADQNLLETSIVSTPETIRFLLDAKVTNAAMLGGVLHSTTMDVYATLNGKEVQLLSFTIPETTVAAKSKDQTVGICTASAGDSFCSLSNLSDLDLDKLQLLVQSVLREEFIEMRMVAPDGVKLSAFGMPLPFSFPFDKSFTAAGMNGAMDKVQITTFDLSHSTPEVLAFHATAHLYNPSIFGFSFLPSEMEIYTLRDSSVASQASCPHEIYVGMSQTVETVEMEAGAHVTMTMEGSMNPNTVNTDCVENFIARYFSGLSNTVLAKITPQASSSIYLNAMMGNTVMQASMTDGYAGDLFESSVVNGMSFGVTEVDEIFDVVTEMNVTMKNPVGSSKCVTKSMGQMHVKMIVNGKSIGTLHGAGALLDTNPNDNLNVLMGASGQLVIDTTSPEEGAAFAAFTHELFTKDGAMEITLDGTVQATVETLLGEMTVPALKLTATISVTGLGGLASNKIISMDLSQSTDSEIIMNVEMEAINPSSNTVITDPLRFNAMFQGTILGYLQCTSATTILAPGRNVLTMTGSLNSEHLTTAADKAAMALILSNFLSGKASDLTAMPSQMATKNVYLNAGLQGVQLNTVMEPLSNAMISGLSFRTMRMHTATENSIGLDSIGEIATFPALGPMGVFTVEKIDMDVQLRAGDQTTVLGSLSIDGIVPTQKVSPRLTVPMEGTIALKDSGAPMGTWMKTFLESETVALHIFGTSTVYAHLPGFTDLIALRGIPIDTSVFLHGMGKSNLNFPVETTFFDLPSNSEKGINVKLGASFNNPSIAEIQIGTVYAEMLYQGVVIGSLIMPDFTIVPGTNELTANGEVRTSSEESFEVMESFFNSYMLGKPARADIRSSVPTSRWLTSVLQDTKMYSMVQGMKSSNHHRVLTPVEECDVDTEVDCGEETTVDQVVTRMTFDEEQLLTITMLRGELPHFEGSLITTIEMPFAFPVSVHSYFGQVELSSPGIGIVGHLTLAERLCTTSCDMAAPVQLDMFGTLDYTGYESAKIAFLQKTVLGTEKVAMHIKGTLHVTINCNLSFHGKLITVQAPLDTSILPDDVSMHLPALEGLGPIKLHKLEVNDGTKTKLPMKAHSEMCNPTTFVKMIMSELTLGVVFQEAVVSVMSTSGITELLPNSCTPMLLSGAMESEHVLFDRDAANLLLSNYVTNIRTPITVRAEPDDSYIVQQALSGIELHSELPALQCHPTDPDAGCALVSKVDFTDFNYNSIAELMSRMMKSNTPNSILHDSQIGMHTQNPFPGTVMTPTLYDIHIYFDGHQMGYIDEGPETPIKGGETEIIPLMVKGMNDDTFTHQLKMTCSLFLDKLYVDAGEGTRIRANIGEFEIEVQYRQKDIKIDCELNNSMRMFCDAVMTNKGVMNWFVRKVACKGLADRRRLYLKSMFHRRRLSPLPALPWGEDV